MPSAEREEMIVDTKGKKQRGNTWAVAVDADEEFD
jgi:hypothetical protein